MLKPFFRPYIKYVAQIKHIFQTDSNSNSGLSEIELNDPIKEAQRLGACLSVPENAAISRKRKILTNPSGKKRLTRGKKDPKVGAWLRVQEHKNEYLIVAEACRLRCDACKETLSKKKSTVKKHIASAKHAQAKKGIELSKKKDQTLIQLLSKHDTANDPKGETLPQDMRIYRIESFLAAGIPLRKIDALRSFLEKYGHRLTSSTHLRQLIPSVHDKETLKKELSKTQAFSCIFYVSTRLGEALAIVVRFLDNAWNIQQRLVRLQTLAKSLKAEEIAQCLIKALAVDFCILPTNLLAAMKDGAAVNQAALRQVKFYFPQLFDVTCFSHTIDNVGKHFQFRVLDKFSQYWVSMFSHSPNVGLAWKTK